MCSPVNTEVSDGRETEHLAQVSARNAHRHWCRTRRNGWRAHRWGPWHRDWAGARRRIRRSRRRDDVAPCLNQPPLRLVPEKSRTDAHLAPRRSALTTRWATAARSRQPVVVSVDGNLRAPAHGHTRVRFLLVVCAAVLVSGSCGSPDTASRKANDPAEPYVFRYDPSPELAGDAALGARHGGLRRTARVGQSLAAASDNDHLVALVHRVPLKGVGLVTGQDHDPGLSTKPSWSADTANSSCSRATCSSGHGSRYRTLS